VSAAALWMRSSPRRRRWRATVCVRSRCWGRRSTPTGVTCRRTLESASSLFRRRSRRRGLTYREIEAQGFYLVVVEAHCRYRRPLRYDQEFIIRTSLRESTPKKFVFDYELLMKEDGTLAAEGSTIHIVTNRGSQVVPLPDPLRLRIAGD